MIPTKAESVWRGMVLFADLNEQDFGMIKLVRVLRPGDVAGLKASATPRYDGEAVALTDVAVYQIPLDAIHTLGAMLNLKLDNVGGEVKRRVREEVIAPLDRLGRVYRVRLPARLQIA